MSVTPSNNVTLKINGVSYGGWTSIEIERSIENIAGSFHLELTDRWTQSQKPIAISEGSPCAVYIGNDLVISGYVDEQHISLDKEGHSITVEGRDASGDLVDCSAICIPSQWKNQKLEFIVAALIKPFGLKVTAIADTGDSFDDFQIEPGETVYEAIHRLCKMAGLLCIPDKKGNLLIIDAESNQCSTAIKEGQNLLSAEYIDSGKERYSQVSVLGQMDSDDVTPGSVANSSFATIQDETVSRYRPLIVRADGQISTDRCATRAVWEIATRTAKAYKLNITVNGWRQGNGALWDINTLVSVDIPTFRVKNQYLVSNVTYSLSDEGQLTHLELAPKEAFILDEEVKTARVKKSVHLG